MVRPFPAPSESSANADSHDGSGKLFQPPRGRTALHYATLGGHLDTVEVLIKAEHEQNGKKATISPKDAEGNTPLHLAVSTGSFEITRLLLEKGANPLAKHYWIHTHEPPPNSGRTPLHLCAGSDALTASTPPESPMGTPQCVGDNIAALLMDYGAVENAVEPDNKGMTPLHHAAVHGNAKVGATLVRCLVEVISHKSQRKTLEAMKDNLRPILFGKDGKVRKKGDEIENHEFDGPKCDKCTQLCGLDGIYNLEGFHLDATRFIERYILFQDDEYSVANKISGQAACHTASFWGHSNFYANIASELRGDGYADIREMLLKKEESLVRDGEGRTRLHHAAMGGQVKEVENLLSKRKNVNLDDKTGKTPLHWAVIWDHPEVVSSLMRANADPELLDRGFDSNYKAAGNSDRDGWAPIHHAARKGHVECIQMLIQHGANSSLRTDDISGGGGFGDTALDICKKFKWLHDKDVHSECKSLLRNGIMPSKCSVM